MGVEVDMQMYNITASCSYITVNGQLFCAVYMYILQLNVANYGGCWMIINRYLNKICCCFGENLTPPQNKVLKTLYAH